MAIEQDPFRRALEFYSDAREAMRENHARMREDMKFSNPAAPMQWKDETTKDREGRPTLTLDQTNQFLGQVINDGRQNTPSIQVAPVDSKGDPLVAMQANGILRHLEYRSRAGIAYDTGLENIARVGLGWLVARPVVVDRELNYQEPRVFGVQDPLAGTLDADSVELDGSDAMRGWLESVMSKEAFARKYPKAAAVSFESAADWCTDKGIRVAEYWEVVESTVSKLQVVGADGLPELLTEDEYWARDKATGVRPLLAAQDRVPVKSRKVTWRKMSGVEFLPDEETEFPADWIGLVPIYGHVVWVDGKRYVCGMTRRLMDGQRLHNYSMSSIAETLLEQPRAPFMVPAEGIEGHDEHWRQLNKGNPAYLPFNALDPEGKPLPSPQRMAPPAFSTAYATLAQLGVQEMQASVGMYKSNLGAPSNAVSGRAKIADKLEGDTATFHYQDNRRISLEHLGRILLQMTARLVDTPRQMRILGIDNKPGTIYVDPTMHEPVKQEGGKVTAIRLDLGEYDARVKVGPSHTTMREELQERLTALGQSNPALAAALAPLMVKMADLPDAERVARICLALLPPNVQAAYNDKEGDTVPPEVKAQMQGLQQQLQQAGEMLTKMAAELDAAHAAAAQATQAAQAEADAKARELGVKEYEARTKRLAVAVDLTQAQGTQAAADGAQAQAAGVADVLATVEQLLGAQGDAAQGLAEAQQILVELAQVQAETQDQLGALTELVGRPRVAHIQYDEAGRPAAAVGVLQ